MIYLVGRWWDIIEYFCYLILHRVGNICYRSNTRYCLGSSGQVFKSAKRDKLIFKEVPELKSIEIVSISGKHNHCFAVSKQGKVFVHGVDSSNLGYLGLGNNIIETTKFVEILSLNKYKICQAYTGC